MSLAKDLTAPMVGSALYTAKNVDTDGGADTGAATAAGSTGAASPGSQPA